MHETALYPPVKAFLEDLGFTVKGEIDSCDILALRPGEPPLLVIAELKLGFSFELILQAIDRLTAADEVWLAVPLTTRGRDTDRRVHRLCRLLGLGLLTVHPKTGRVDIRTAPAPYTPRLDSKWRSRLLREFHARRGDPAQGGSTRRKIMTAYRQHSLDLAARLLPAPARPRDLTDITPLAGTMLRRNVYAWFLRTAPGTYDLTPLGRQEALAWLAQQAAAGLASPPT